MSIELVIPSNHLVVCPLVLLPSTFPSIRIFSKEPDLCMRWPKCWSFSFSISPSNEYSGLFFFRISWFDLAVQGTLKSLLQDHSSKASILWPSLLYGPTLISVHDYWKNHMTIKTFVGNLLAKWYLLLNMLSRFLIAFLPRSKCLLISWLQSPSTVILEPKKINLSLFPFFPPSIYYEVMGPVAMILVFWMLSFNPAFSFSSLTFIKRLFGSSLLSAIRVLSSEVIDISPSKLDSSLWFIQPSISHDILCIWVK